MTLVDKLEHPVWFALDGRQSSVAITCGDARRFHPAYGCFAAIRSRSTTALASLSALVAEHGDVALLEADPPMEVPGAVVVSQDAGVQMTATRMAGWSRSDVQAVPLDETDAADMLALATLTRPGPFFGRTHRLGAFLGVKIDGQLVAMAGERMKPDGFVEVSGVCTHPDHRGCGLAAALMRMVSERILARGEVPFLHAYASNTGAIALYERLGFRTRRTVSMTRLARR